MRTGLLAALAVGLAGTAGADICGPGARATFPMSVILDEEAGSYQGAALNRVDFTTADPDDFVPHAGPFAEVVAERAAALPGALRDLPYLIVLGEQVEHPDGLIILTYGALSTVLPEIVAALDARGLTAEAALARVPLQLYPDWDAGPMDRLRSPLDPITGLPPGTQGLALLAASEALHRAAPKIREATLALIATDPGLAAEYQARLTSADTAQRVQYLIWELVERCEGSWRTPEEADAVFGALGPAQRDILLLHWYEMESYSDSPKQYFSNPAATMAPQLATALDRAGLATQAAALRDGMALFPTPYPRDIEARTAALAAFSDDQTTALEALALWPGPGRIFDAIVRVAEAGGIVPD